MTRASKILPVGPLNIPKRVLALDPGPEWTAWVILADGKPSSFGHEPNEAVLLMVSSLGGRVPMAFAVEMIASYGMPVGREVFDTCVWIGRYVQAWGGPHTLIYRAQVKTHLCHNQKANDASIRAALLDRFGPGKAKAVGVKKTKGPLYGITGDVWAALAVAVTCADSLSPTGAQHEHPRPVRRGDDRGM